MNITKYNFKSIELVDSLEIPVFCYQLIALMHISAQNRIAHLISIIHNQK